MNGPGVAESCMLGYMPASVCQIHRCRRGASRASCTGRTGSSHASGMQGAQTDPFVRCSQDPASAPPRPLQSPWAQKLPHSPSLVRLLGTGQASRPPAEDLRTPSPVSAALSTPQHGLTLLNRFPGPSSSGTRWQSALSTAGILTQGWHCIRPGGGLALNADMPTTGSLLQCALNPSPGL